MPWPIDIQADTATVRIDEITDVDPLPDLVALELSLSQQAVRSIEELTLQACGLCAHR